MSEWSSIKINIDPLAKLRPPLKSMLSVLETVEAVLEALLALIKMFSLDLLNPLRAIIALLLAAIRAILNQIKATGFAVLLVRPDFRRSDLRAVFNSVSGGYAAFESKVLGKFYDESDPFRPTYTSGMHVAMAILYIGAESAGDLMSEIIALLNLIKHPMDDLGLAAPVSLKVSTPTKSGDPVSQFWQLFMPSDANKSLVLEWKLPTSASGIGSPTAVGQIAASLPSYNLGQKFIIERSEADHPSGELLYAHLESKTQGKRVENTIRRYNVASVSTRVVVKERGGGNYRFFRKRMKVDNWTYMGGLTGTYRYIDTQLEEGKTYYYRVRTYMGTLSEKYVDATIDNPDTAALQLTKQDPQFGWVIDYGSGVTVSNPSAVVKGFVPPQVSNSEIFDLYKDLLNAVLVGLLLNFELPYPDASDNAKQRDQKTGWGTLSMLAGPIGIFKSSSPNSADFVKEPFLKPAVRRAINPVLEKLRTQPQLIRRLEKMWVAGVKGTVTKVTSEVGFEFTAAGLGGVKAVTDDQQIRPAWGVYGVIGDVTDATRLDIKRYLGLESSSYGVTAGALYEGPVPLEGSSSNAFGISVSVQERSDLADLLRVALSVGSQSSYMQWYSVTIGDLFPALVPFMFDFEQWILALLKAVESALKEITDIIETLLQRVRDLEQLLKAIIALLEMLNIDLTVSFLWVTGNNGLDDLVQGLMTSENKPGSKPYGLHSGYVMTAGGPGPGFTKALEALKFLLTFGKE